MKLRYIFIALSVVIVVVILVNFIRNNSNAPDRNTLTQYSTINALLNKVYEGEFTVKEVKEHGDFGLGTFNSMNGEMVVFDGHVYRVSADGVAREPLDDEKIPFTAVTYFDIDLQFNIDPGISMDSLEKKIDSLIPTKNIFYAIKITGVFEKVKTRSVPKQNKPYKPITEIVKTQPTFEFTDVKGTVIGFRCPQYMDGINVPGYHFHFLTEDKKAGGHILALTTGNDTLEMDKTMNYSLILPSNKDFYNVDLTPQKEEVMNKVEKENKVLR